MMQDSSLLGEHQVHGQSQRHPNDSFYKFAVFNDFNSKLEQSFEQTEQPTHGLFHSTFNSDSAINFPYTTSQIACICKTLYLNREGEKLNQFFETQQQARQLCEPVPFFNNSTSEVVSHDLAAVFCAYLFALYHRGNYDELFERIRYSKLDSSYHCELQKLWYEAHYAEDQEKKTKKLGPVDKYRIRHKFPPPASVWDGEKIIYAFKERQRKILNDFYRRNRYPKPDEKQEIARCTGLKMAQISNWFKNKRQRNKSSAHPNDFQSLLDTDSLNLNSAGFF